MDEAGDVHPIEGGMEATTGLCSLKGVLELTVLSVRVAVIDELVEEDEGVPDGEREMIEGQILRLHRTHKVVRLMSVLQAIEVSDSLRTQRETRGTGG